MTRREFLKSTMVGALGLCVASMPMGNVMAAPENAVMDEVANDIDAGYYDEFGNYENPETGEYFRWNNPGVSTAANYGSYSGTFRCLRQLYTGIFSAGSTNGDITITSHYEDANENIISVSNWSKNVSVGIRKAVDNKVKVWGAAIPQPGVYTKLFSGTTTGTEYCMLINNDDYSNVYYLAGDITITFR